MDGNCDPLIESKNRGQRRLELHGGTSPCANADAASSQRGRPRNVTALSALAGMCAQQLADARYVPGASGLGFGTPLCD